MDEKPLDLGTDWNWGSVAKESVDDDVIEYDLPIMSNKELSVKLNEFLDKYNNIYSEILKNKVLLYIVGDIFECGNECGFVIYGEDNCEFDFGDLVQSSNAHVLYDERTKLNYAIETNVDYLELVSKKVEYMKVEKEEVDIFDETSVSYITDTSFDLKTLKTLINQVIDSYELNPVMFQAQFRQLRGRIMLNHKIRKFANNDKKIINDYYQAINMFYAGRKGKEESASDFYKRQIDNSSIYYNVKAESLKSLIGYCSSFGISKGYSRNL